VSQAREYQAAQPTPSTVLYTRHRRPRWVTSVWVTAVPQHAGSSREEGRSARDGVREGGDERRESVRTGH
jgi:hypothetical protein